MTSRSYLGSSGSGGTSGGAGGGAGNTGGGGTDCGLGYGYGYVHGRGDIRCNSFGSGSCDGKGSCNLTGWGCGEADGNIDEDEYWDGSGYAEAFIWAGSWMVASKDDILFVIIRDAIVERSLDNLPARFWFTREEAEAALAIMVMSNG